MADRERAVPDLSEPDTAEFWRLAQDHRLTYQVCVSCGRVVFYPRAHCPRCGANELQVHDSAGNGRVYSYAVIRQTPDPAFRGDVPYIVALIDLAEGFRLLTHLRAEPETAAVGQQVRLEWMTRDGFEFPVFAPAP
jgi:uncharacterized OB-fold protein